MPPQADLPGFLHGVAPILDRWGYTAVAAMIGVESFGVPAPGQTIMVAAAIYAGAGRLNIFGVAAVAFIAAVLGDNVGYWIGMRGGRKAVHRWGKYVFLTPERLERAEDFFARKGGRVVLVARFIDGLRQFNGVIAGITAMPWRTFLLFNTIGALLWVGWWTSVAFVFGTHLVEIIEHAHRYKWWAIAAVTLAVGAYITLHLRHIRRRRARSLAAAVIPDLAPDDPQSEALPAGSPEAAIPEASTPEASTPEASIPRATTPGAATPEAAADEPKPGDEHRSFGETGPGSFREPPPFESEPIERSSARRSGGGA